MISHSLQSIFFTMEVLGFEAWKSASSEEKDLIVKRIAKAESSMILAEIEKEVRNKYK